MERHSGHYNPRGGACSDRGPKNSSAGTQGGNSAITALRPEKETRARIDGRRAAGQLGGATSRSAGGGSAKFCCCSLQRMVKIFPPRRFESRGKSRDVICAGDPACAGQPPPIISGTRRRVLTGGLNARSRRALHEGGRGHPGPRRFAPLISSFLAAADRPEIGEGRVAGGRHLGVGGRATSWPVPAEDTRRRVPYGKVELPSPGSARHKNYGRSINGFDLRGGRRFSQALAKRNSSKMSARPAADNGIGPPTLPALRARSGPGSSSRA